MAASDPVAAVLRPSRAGRPRPSERRHLLTVTVTDDQRALRERARHLAESIEPYEQRCETDNGLSPEDLAALKLKVLEASLNATNIPRELGGQGLGALEQVIVEEQVGRLTNSLWAIVWRPANALCASSKAQRERYLMPAVEGRRRGAFAISEQNAGSDPRGLSTLAEVAPGGRYRLRGEKWFVTSGDVADFLIVLARVAPSGQFALFLVDSAIDIAVNRAFLYDVAAEVDAGADRKMVHAKAAMTKLAASEAAGRVVDRAVQIFGGRGYMRSYAVERLYREVRVDRIWEGTSEMQRIIVANHLTKRGLDGLLSPPWG